MRGAVQLERKRDIDFDPAFGMEQLEDIGWTSISTSKQDPAPGLHAIRVLSHWCDAQPDVPDRPPRAMNTMESLAVVSTESMQHQIYAEVIHAITLLLPKLAPDQQQRAERLIARILSGIGDHETIF